jgi:hypothetical protein
LSDPTGERGKKVICPNQRNAQLLAIWERTPHGKTAANNMGRHLTTGFFILKKKLDF